MESITSSEAQTIFSNSGLLNMDHGSNKFNENDFLNHFYRSGDSDQDLERCFIEYLAETNSKTHKQIINEYSL